MKQAILDAIEASLTTTPQRPINHHLIGPQRRNCLRLIAQADRFNRHHLGDEDTISLYDHLYHQGPSQRPVSPTVSSRQGSIDIVRLLEDLERYEMHRLVDTLMVRVEQHMWLLANILTLHRHRGRPGSPAAFTR